MAEAARAKRRTRVSQNEGVVLGMLARQASSGYELVGRIRTSVGYFWTPARSHVYSILPRLESLGLARSRVVPGERAPDKHVYEITEEGRAALREWLASPELSEGPPRNPFLVKVFFGWLLDREELAAHVRERRDAIAVELAELEEIARNVDRRANPASWLTVTYGIEADRGILRWAEAALRALEEAG